MTDIYGLYDASGNLRYIGKANDPAKRLASHMRDARRRRAPVYDWINKHGRPEMRVLESNCVDWREAERRLIAEARARGDRLLNLADGGDEPGCSTETRKANGRLLAGRLNGTIPYPPHMLTREAIIIDTYEWVLRFCQRRGRYDKCVELADKMMAYAQREPDNFPKWREIHVSRQA